MSSKRGGSESGKGKGGTAGENDAGGGRKIISGKMKKMLLKEKRAKEKGENVECGMWNVECGMWNVECGMWNVECVSM